MSVAIDTIVRALDKKNVTCVCSFPGLTESNLTHWTIKCCLQSKLGLHGTGLLAIYLSMLDMMEDIPSMVQLVGNTTR